MNSNSKYKVLAFALGMFALTACDMEKDVEPVMDANSKPQITIKRIGESSADNFINEGDILEIEISSSKMMEGTMDFELLIEGLTEDIDYTVLSGASIAPYTTTAVAKIEVLNDKFPENSENLKIKLIADDIAQNWRLNPNSLDTTTLSYEVKNVNTAGAYSFGFVWEDSHDDYDMYIYSVTADDFWGGANVYDAATGNWPETTAALKTSDPDGTYYIGVDPYAVEHDITTYTISVGLENGTSQVFTGTLDLNDESLEYQGGVIALLKIVKTGSNIVVTHLN